MAIQFSPFDDFEVDVLSNKLSKSGLPERLPESESESDVPTRKRTRVKSPAPKLPTLKKTSSKATTASLAKLQLQESPKKPSNTSPSGFPLPPGPANVQPLNSHWMPSTLNTDDTLEPDGDMNEVRDEYLLLKKFDNGGYDEFGLQELLDLTQDNWNCWLVEFLKPDTLQPKMVPHVADWIKKSMLRKGESVEEYEAQIRKDPKSVYDWGMGVLAHLALLSEYTRNQGDVVLGLLNQAVDGRVKRARGEARKNPELMAEDVKRVVEDILREAEVAY